MDEALRQPGEPLPGSLRSSMESFFGEELSSVRVHQHAQAGASAQAVGARAYTVGPHIAFAPGQYSPGSRSGQRLIAHELTHVIQQRGTGGVMQASPAVAGLAISAPSDVAEVEAERIAGLADLQLHGGVEVESTSAVHVRTSTGPMLARDVSTTTKTKPTWTETIRHAVQEKPSTESGQAYERWASGLRAIFRELDAGNAKIIHDRLTGAPGTGEYKAFRDHFGNNVPAELWKELIGILTEKTGAEEPLRSPGATAPKKQPGKVAVATFDEALRMHLERKPVPGDEKWTRWVAELKALIESMAQGPAERLMGRLLKRPADSKDKQKFADPLGQLFWDTLPPHIWQEMLEHLSVRASPPVKVRTQPLTKPEPLGTATSKQGIVYKESGATLRKEPETISEAIEKIKLNTHVYVDREWKGWYRVYLATGKFGWVDSAEIKTNLPEPGAIIHHIKSGETALDIARQHYKGGNEWGKDKRYYVNVLVYVNKGSGKRGIYQQKPGEPEEEKVDRWEDTRTRANYMIWIPTRTFADSLRAKVGSGSISYDAWESIKSAVYAAGEFVVGGAAFVAGVLHGALESLWDVLVGLWDLAGMLWDILVSYITGQLLNDAKGLVDSLSGLDWGALVEGWINDFSKKWDAPGLLERWHFRGWVIGYVIMEILMLVFSGGIISGVKWAGKAAKASKVVKAIAKIAKVEKLAEASKDLARLKKLLQGAKKAETASDVGKAAKAEEAAKAAKAAKAKDGAKAAELAKGTKIAERPVKLGDEVHHVRVIVREGRHVVTLCSDPCKAILARIEGAVAKGSADPKELAKLKGRVAKIQADLDAGILKVDDLPGELAKVEGDLKGLKKDAFDLARKAKERQRLLDEGIAKAEKKAIDPAEKKWLDADRRRKELAYDPDTGSFKVQEAKAALKAEASKVLEPPVTRAMNEAGHSMGGDIVDGLGVAWDVKDWRGGVAKAKEALEAGERVLVDLDGADAVAEAALRALETSHPGKIKYVR